MQIGLFLINSFSRITFEKPITRNCVIKNKPLMRNQDNSFTLKKKSLIKNKLELTGKNAVTPIHGSCKLRVWAPGVFQQANTREISSIFCFS